MCYYKVVNCISAIPFEPENRHSGIRSMYPRVRGNPVLDSFRNSPEPIAPEMADTHRDQSSLFNGNTHQDESKLKTLNKLQIESSPKTAFVSSTPKPIVAKVPVSFFPFSFGRNSIFREVFYKTNQHGRVTPAYTPRTPLPAGPADRLPGPSWARPSVPGTPCRPSL